MKIIFDIDGTLTDYNAFVQKTATPWLAKHYGWQPVNPDAIEIEDIFDIRKRCTGDECEKIMDRFWISHRFLKYALLTRFRPYAARTVWEFREKGYQVELFTSRKKTADKNVVGSIARLLTYIQLAINGVLLSGKAIHFFKNDQEKAEAIIHIRPQIMVDDKPIIVEKLNAAKIKVVCVSDFEPAVFNQELCKVYGARSIQMMDNLAQSGRFYRKLMLLRGILLGGSTKVQILNEQNLVKDYGGGILYVSNHRSTLDPLYITGYINREIHWVALKRFFTSEDSIFNNSKNPLLCKITQYCFNKLYFFPIERKKDNPSADNFQTAKAMNTCLKVGGSVGIFPEGTATRREEDDFNTFDPGFIGLAEQTKAIIQPITVFWEGYYKNPQATAEVFEGEWFKTGDLGYTDAKGFLYITGRKKNLIILPNGENVSPEELEQKILRFPYVKEVVVSEKNGQIQAEIFPDRETEPNAEKTISDDIVELNKTLPNYKKIGRTLVRDQEFEKTTTQKIKRNQHN